MPSKGHIAYLVNQYPAVSHTFIRREIRALEELGVRITRLSVRKSRSGLVDPTDLDESRRTTVLLSSPYRLCTSTYKVGMRHPFRWICSAASAVQSAFRSSARLKQVAYLVEACRLYEICKHQGITHVHVHMGTNAASVARYCRQLGGPTYSITMHGPDEWANPAGLELAKKARNAAFVACISEHASCQLHASTDKSDHHKIHIVRCGLDDAFFDRSSVPISKNQNLVCIGRLCPAKNQVLLVETYAKLLKAHPCARLTICGEGELYSEIDSKIKDLKLEHAVRLTGWANQDQVISNILESRALVLPSLTEGLPVVIMEALALCRPVISTSVAGIPELIEPGVNGWLVPPDDPDQLLRAMTECLDTDEQSLYQMGLRGQVTVRRMHDIRKNVLHLNSLYTQITTDCG